MFDKIFKIILIIGISASFSFADYDEYGRYIEPKYEDPYKEIKALGLNILVPGLGLCVIMDDCIAGVMTFGIVAGGVSSLIYFNKHNQESGNYDFRYFFIGSIALVLGEFLNIWGPFQYDKPPYKTSSNKSNFNMAILPNEHGNFKTYLFYNKTF